jgi:hypothetical protein
MERDMPSDSTLNFEFVPPANIFDALRIHFRLAVMARKARKIARRRDQGLASVAPHLRYDVGATDMPRPTGLADLVSHHPCVIAGGIWSGHRPL